MFLVFEPHLARSYVGLVQDVVYSKEYVFLLPDLCAAQTFLIDHGCR